MSSCAIRKKTSACVYEKVELAQDLRQFDFMSARGKGADYVLPGDEKAVTPPPPSTATPSPPTPEPVKAEEPAPAKKPRAQRPHLRGKALDQGCRGEDQAGAQEEDRREKAHEPEP